ncbi:hypothetical protein [Rhizobium sp. No.120]
MAIVDKGRLALCDIARDYLANLRPRQSEEEIADIIIKNLLTHTAGLSCGVGPKTAPPERMFNAGLSDTDLDLWRTSVRRLLKAEAARTALLNQIGNLQRPGKPGKGFSFLGAVVQDPALAEVPMSNGSISWGGFRDTVGSSTQWKHGGRRPP